jgi:hypothetical protein
MGQRFTAAFVILTANDTKLTGAPPPTFVEKKPNRHFRLKAGLAS